MIQSNFSGILIKFSVRLKGRQIKNSIFFSMLMVFLNFSVLAVHPERELIKVNLNGSGYELGLQHGKTLRNEIANIIQKWKINASKQLNKEAEVIVSDFFKYAQFDDSIQKWTPDLYEEIKGIAEGSGQNFKDILLLNLIDEFWVYVDKLSNHHCTTIGVPSVNGSTSYIAQNMDLERWTDGFQVLMRISRSENSPEQLILTHPGLIALTGMNEAGVGVVLNTIMHLRASATGLPVAFVARQILALTDESEILKFITTVNHASGQNYIIGIRGNVYNFEASANHVVRFVPKNKNGVLYHTNHPIINYDIKSRFEGYLPKLAGTNNYENPNVDSLVRFDAVKQRMEFNPKVSSNSIMDTLRSKDDTNYPVCKALTEERPEFTFASVIMKLTGKPSLQIVAGPPDEGEYRTIHFTTK